MLFKYDGTLGALNSKLLIHIITQIIKYSIYTLRTNLGGGAVI